MKRRRAVEGGEAMIMPYVTYMCAVGGQEAQMRVGTKMTAAPISVQIDIKIIKPVSL